MSFNRMWNYVSGWSPFKTQANPRVSMEQDPGIVIAKQEYDSVVNSMKPEDSKKVQQLLRSSCESLKQQFSVKQQYKGDAIHNTIDKHLELLTTKATSAPSKSNPDRTPAGAKDSSHTKPSTSPARAETGTLSKDDINKNLDIFSSDAFTESAADAEVAVKHFAPDTGRAKPQAEEKVVKASGGSTGLSTSEITSAFDAFEAGAGKTESKDAVKEAVLKPDTAIVTGYRGNPYYEEELRKAVDDSMDVGKEKETKPVGPSKDATDGKDKPKARDGKDTKPAEALHLKPAIGKDTTPAKAPAVQPLPAQTGTGLSKDQITGNLDIFESSFADEIPNFETRSGIDEAEIVHVARAQDTGRSKPVVEEKIVRAPPMGGVTSLSKDEISSALDAFEAGMGADDSFSSKLTADFTDGAETVVGEAKEAKEVTLKPDTAIVTGYRGNPYYEEELRKAVDDSMDVGKDKETKPVGPSKDATDGKDKKETKPVDPPKQSADIKQITADKDKIVSPNVVKVSTDIKEGVTAPAVTPPSTSVQKPDQPQVQSDKSEAKHSGPVVSEINQKTAEEQLKPSSDGKISKPDKVEKPTGEPTEKKPKSAEVAKEHTSKLEEKTEKKTAEHTPDSSASKSAESSSKNEDKK